jgi:putative endonuclease
MAQHNKLGKQGEELAEKYLASKGCQILERNWRFSRYELDIIAESRNFIIFVEVKTRASENWGNPEDAVSERKMKRMVEAADFYLKNFDIDKPARFDIAAIVMNGHSTSLHYIEDAFLPPLG